MASQVMRVVKNLPAHAGEDKYVVKQHLDNLNSDEISPFLSDLRL